MVEAKADFEYTAELGHNKLGNIIEKVKPIRHIPVQNDKLSPEEQKKQHPVVERKQFENVKRLKTMVDQFGSPIIVHWLSSIPTEKAGEKFPTILKRAREVFGVNR